MNPAHLIVLGAALLAALPASAATCKAASGPTLVPVVELYTSEGCSSCPPADKWFSSIDAKSAVVPLAFHVDYWDYIGWRRPLREFGVQPASARGSAASRRPRRLHAADPARRRGTGSRGCARGSCGAVVAKIAQRAPVRRLRSKPRTQSGTLDCLRAGFADGCGRNGDALVYLAVTEESAFQPCDRREKTAASR